MKKFLICLVLFICVAAASFAQVPKDQTRYPYQEAEISYRNYQVYKVLDHKQVYVVIYQKAGLNIGQVTIPKKWYKERPMKLKLRSLPKGMQAYLSVFTKNGEFDHCVLTVPSDRGRGVWGVADSNVVIDDADKDTLVVPF